MKCTVLHEMYRNMQKYKQKLLEMYYKKKKNNQNMRKNVGIEQKKKKKRIQPV